MKFFWHNPIMNALEIGLVKLTNYIWLKRRAAFTTAKKTSNTIVNKQVKRR